MPRCSRPLLAGNHELSHRNDVRRLLTLLQRPLIMCGIAGILNLDGAPVAAEHSERMCSTIGDRGPDERGLLVRGEIGLGMRRLSIIDLGNGHQPVSNEDGTVWVVFNGEIYNYPSLRERLLARGHR